MGKEIRPEHRNCVCCEEPLEQGVPAECVCQNPIHGDAVGRAK